LQYDSIDYQIQKSNEENISYRKVLFDHFSTIRGDTQPLDI